MRCETVAVGCYRLLIGLFERLFWGVPFTTGRHRLRPLGSINVPFIRRESLMAKGIRASGHLSVES
jgi:hypothetical protein